MAAVETRVCETAGCSSEAKLQCPTCLKLGIQGSYFCSQVRPRRRRSRLLAPLPPRFPLALPVSRGARAVPAAGRPSLTAPGSCEAPGRAGGGGRCRPEPLAGPVAALRAGAPSAPRLRVQRWELG